MTNPKHTDTSRSGDHNGPEQTFRDTERNLRDRIAALKAENERLREALAEVLSDDEALMDITWVRRARAALGEG